MPRILYETCNKKRILVIGLSNDWRTLTPWKHGNKIMSYFDSFENVSESGQVYFKYQYIGPFSIVIGRWIGKRREM